MVQWGGLLFENMVFVPGHTVNSEIFARVLISGNLAYAKFREN